MNRRTSLRSALHPHPRRPRQPGPCTAVHARRARRHPRQRVLVELCTEVIPS